ncbi:hypothetical protein Lrub_2330 [Legionella rubrilucens]|uniref:Uncharacterized protein n=1 Tax=Legionella rubrilucens TaxID=458 RepID=A0A0W0XLI2_9GAMM|nr:hypothetical protein Lrub_2330 [Legionella rubrilucens]
MRYNAANPSLFKRYVQYDYGKPTLLPPVQGEDNLVFFLRKSRELINSIIMNGDFDKLETERLIIFLIKTNHAHTEFALYWISKY